MSCTISDAIPIVSPSPTTDWFHSTTARLPFAGVTPPTTISTNRCPSHAMSFSVASCLICSPRASSASATSASSPIEGAPLCCHAVSPLSTQFHRKPNRNPRPHQPPSPCGALPSAVDPCPSWNDSPRRNSNSVLHHSWPQLHEITRSHPALVTLQSVSPKCVSLLSRHL